MFHGMTWRDRLKYFAATAILISGSSTLGSAYASEPPPYISQKVASYGNVWAKLTENPSAKLPVIVRFSEPTIGQATHFATPEDADTALTRSIHAAQDSILNDVFSDSGIASAEVDDKNLKRLDFTPAFGITVGADEVAELARNPNVLQIVEDVPARPLLNESLPQINMPQVFAAGFTGDGYRIAILDSGAIKSHKFLNSRIVSEACYNTNNPQAGIASLCPGGVEQATGPGSGEDCKDFEIHGCAHGTHVSGIAAGFNTNRISSVEPETGVARNARLISINVFSHVTGSRCDPLPLYHDSCIRSFVTDQIRGLERVYALRHTMNIAAVNMSLGDGLYSSPCDDDLRKVMIDRLRAARIATVVAAGNSGHPNAVSAPACVSSAIAVGSMMKSGYRSTFSNWGDQVDLIAPGGSGPGNYNHGYDITSSHHNRTTSGIWGSLYGTSMAAPHVAGAFAVLRQVKPDANVAEIETVLKQTGRNVGGSRPGRPQAIDVDAARLQLRGSGGGTASIVAATTPVARATRVGVPVTAYATILNSGNVTATTCSISKMPTVQPYNVSYRSRNHVTGALGPVNTPVNIAAGGRQDFLMTFVASAPMQSNLQLSFDCANTSRAPIAAGVNTFLLTARATAPADVISTAVTPTQDGVLRVPRGSTGIAALAANNIGASASLQARLSSSPISGSSSALPLGLSMCRTNPTTGACTTGRAGTINFTASPNQIITFTAFAEHRGTAIPLAPADRRLFIHFYQGSTSVGSASVAVCTVGAANCSASGSSSQTAELVAVE